MYWRSWELPVPFFPNAGLRFVEKGGDRDDREFDWALNSARYLWKNNWGGESTDPYVQRVFGDEDP